MKKLIVAAILAVTLTVGTTPVMAGKDTKADIENMELDELLELKEMVNEAIEKKGGSNLLPEGRYIVGVDIEAGQYNFTAKEESVIDIFETAETEDPIDGAYLYPDDIFGINASDGMMILVSHGSGALDKTFRSFAPKK